MYDLVSGISLYLEREHAFKDKLMSGPFTEIRNTGPYYERKYSRGGRGDLKGTQSLRSMRRPCGPRRSFGTTALIN